MTSNKLTGIFVVVMTILILSATHSFAFDVVVGRVVKVNLQKREIVLKIKNDKKEFTFSKKVKIYYKSFKNRLKWAFLKSNLIPGAKIKVVTNDSNDIINIFIMEIPQ